MGKITFKIISANICELSFESEEDPKMEIEIVTRKEMTRGHLSAGQICTLTFKCQEEAAKMNIPDGWVRVSMG